VIRKVEQLKHVSVLFDMFAVQLVHIKVAFVYES